MLRHLALSNFKAWAHADVALAPITGLFGTNSSGKTSLLQFLLLLKLTKEASDRALALDLGSAGKLVNLGTYKDIVHRHDTSRSLTWELRWESTEPLTITDPEASQVKVLFESSNFGLASEIQAPNGLRSVLT